MRVRDLSTVEIRERMRGHGLKIAIGPFNFQFHSDLEVIAEAIQTLYTDFPVPEVEFVDIRFGVHRLPWWQRLSANDITTMAEGQLLFKNARKRVAVAYWEWGINYCVAVHSHHLLMLHAAVVAREDRALVIVGRSGAGKSTLCAGLHLAGWRLLSDEFAITPLIDSESQPCELLGLAKPIALKDRSIQVVRQLCPDAIMGPISRNTSKGDVAHLKPDQRSVEQVNQPVKPAAIVFVNYVPGSSAKLEPVTKAMSMYRLGTNSFNFGTAGRRGFETLAALVDQSEAFELTYCEMDEVTNVLQSEFDSIQLASMR